MSKQLSSFQPRTGITKLYMPFNGNSVDISGNGNHGTDTSVTYVGGKFGQGAKLTNSSLITLPNLNFGTSNFTISFWLYPQVWGSNKRIWASSTSVSSPYNNFEINYNTTNGFNVNHYNGSTDLTVKNGTNYPSINNWHHIVVTRNGDNLYVYVDNTLFASGSGWSTRDCTGNSQQTIGLVFSNTLESIIDEIFVENRAWTPQEISTYYRKSMKNYRQRSLFNLIKDFVLTGDTAVFTITGYNASLTLIQRLVAETANLVITGYDALIKVTGGWRNPDNKSSTTYSNPDNKSSSTWTNRNKNS